MMPVRRACSAILALASAAAGLAGCSSGHSSPGRLCCSAPDAYALYVTSAGRVSWRRSLAGTGFGSRRLPPLAVGDVAVFAQGDALYGLRLADGRRLWEWDAGSDVTGLWRWRGLVIALTEPPGGWPLLTGLVASTGKARWTRTAAPGVDYAYPAGDGGLVVIRSDDTLEMVSLSSGRVRWARSFGTPSGTSVAYPPPLAAAGGAVLFAVNGRLTSYDDRTGRIRWSDALTPVEVADDLGLLDVQATARLVYVTGVIQRYAGGQRAQMLLGINPADGRVTWRFEPRPPETLSPYADGLVSVTSGSVTSQGGLDLATGRVRWQVASGYLAVATAAGVVIAPGTADTHELSMHDARTGQTRWTARLTGLNLGWRLTAPALPVFPVGSLLTVPAAGWSGPDLLTAFRLSDGHRAWQVTLPDPPAARPSAVPGGMLIYAADLRLPP